MDFYDTIIPGSKLVRWLTAVFILTAACHGSGELCGDGVASGLEACDGSDLRGRTCGALGLPGDGLGCLPSCVLDLGACVAAAPREEVALDGAGTATLPGSAEARFAVAIPDGQTGTLTVHIERDDGRCPAVAVEILDGGRLVSSGTTQYPPDFTSCAEVIARGLPSGIATARVRPLGAPADYTLRLDLSLAPCGDGVVQPDQECDGGAGCSATCRLVDRALVEPDDQPVAAAGPFAPPFAAAGRLERAGDVDWIAVDVDRPLALRLAVEGPCEPDCAALDLMRIDGDDLVVETPRALAPGRYYLRLRGLAAGTAYRVVALAEARADTCGDGVLDEGEECDDGNLARGDCCGATCAVEPGCEREPNDSLEQATPVRGPATLFGILDRDLFGLWLPYAGVDARVSSDCAGVPGMTLTFIDESFTSHVATAGADGCVALGFTSLLDWTYFLEVDGPPGAPYLLSFTVDSYCGDGVVAGSETCDDGAACVARGCDRVARCGDGWITKPETCDDGNDRDGDDCPAGCGAPAVPGSVDPSPTCGDGRRDPAEGCDDGNHDPGDGCDAACAAELGHHFEREPNDDGSPAIGDDDFAAAAAEGPFAGSIVLHGALDPAGDEDVFAFAAAGRLTARADGLLLRLRDPSGKILAAATSLLSAPLAAGELLQVSDPGDNSRVDAYRIDVRIE